MAGRIKYPHINSAKAGTAKRSESNSAASPLQLESNITTTPQRAESNSRNGPQQLESNTRVSALKQTVEAGDDSNFSLFTRILEDLLNFTTSSENDNPTEQSGLFDYEPKGEDTEEEGVRNKSVGQQTGGNSSGGDDGSDGDANSGKDETERETDTESDTNKARTQNTHTGADQDTPQSSQSIPKSAYLPEPTTKEALVNAQRPSEMVDGPLRGDVYYRTSSEDNDGEDTQITIDQQQPLVEAALKAFNIKPYGEPVKDKAISGETFDRPGLEQIEEDAKEGNINVVVVSDIDRLGRVCEKTIEFVKRLRYEYEVYIVSNVRWYDVSDGDDLETFNAKAGRAEAENKKRGGRGNRGKLFKLVDDGSDAYLSWFKKIPIGCVKSNAEKGIKLAEDARRQIPKIVLKEFMDLSAEKHEYAKTEKRVRRRLNREFDREFDVDLNIKRILANPVYTGRAVIQITEAETHSVDQAEIGIDMPELRLYDDEEIELWEQAQKRIERLNQRNRDKTGSRPAKLVTEYGPEMVDETIASWTLICPKCGSISEYEYHGTTVDKDGTRRQKCKCNGNDESHFFRIPTRDEYEALEERDTGGDTDSSDLVN